MTPTVIQRLREAWEHAFGAAMMRRHYGPCQETDRTEAVHLFEEAEAATNAEITAVERELAAKDAEIAELRKRPTLEEVEEAVDAVCATWEGHDMGKTIVLLAVIRKLYAEKARAEAPK